MSNKDNGFIKGTVFETVSVSDKGYRISFNLNDEEAGIGDMQAYDELKGCVVDLLEKNSTLKTSAPKATLYYYGSGKVLVNTTDSRVYFKGFNPRDDREIGGLLKKVE
jgi:hypothetical protein